MPVDEGLGFFPEGGEVVRVCVRVDHLLELLVGLLLERLAFCCTVPGQLVCSPLDESSQDEMGESPDFSVRALLDGPTE